MPYGGEKINQNLEQNKIISGVISQNLPPLARFGSLANVVRANCQPYPRERFIERYCTLPDGIDGYDLWAAFGYDHSGGLMAAKVMPALDDPDQICFDSRGLWSFILPVFAQITPGAGNDDEAAVDLVAFGDDRRRPLTWTGGRITLGPDHLIDPMASPRMYREPWRWVLDGGPLAGCCICGGPGQ